MGCRPLLLITSATLSLLIGCAAGPSSQTSNCGPSGLLKVGIAGSSEGEDSSAAERLADRELFDLRDKLMAASRCDVQLEPVRSPEQARARLLAQEWDVAFLPPGLMALSMDSSPPYVPVRILGSDRHSRSSIVTTQDSRIRQRADLAGARLGLLPRGSLTGFYLPLYNLHGLRLGRVVYAISYGALLQLLREGQVDAIAWDEARTEPAIGLRRVLADQHTIPLGAMVVRQQLQEQGVIPLLQSLDASAQALSPVVSYVPAPVASDQGIAPLRAIVTNVESWTLPHNGQPYRVFGPRR